MMVGREVMLHANKPACESGEIILSVNHLSVKDFNNILRVDDVSFDIHEGEIVGIAGVAGSGQSEIAATLMGLVLPEPDSEICFLGKDIKIKSVRERRALE